MCKLMNPDKVKQIKHKGFIFFVPSPFNEEPYFVDIVTDIKEKYIELASGDTLSEKGYYLLAKRDSTLYINTKEVLEALPEDLGANLVDELYKGLEEAKLVFKLGFDLKVLQ